MLGRLDRTFGRRAFHIHLTRDPDDVAQSYARRKFGIAQAYQRDVVFVASGDLSRVVP